MLLTFCIFSSNDREALCLRKVRPKIANHTGNWPDQLLYIDKENDNGRRKLHNDASASCRRVMEPIRCRPVGEQVLPRRTGAFGQPRHHCLESMTTLASRLLRYRCSGPGRTRSGSGNRFMTGRYISFWVLNTILSLQPPSSFVIPGSLSQAWRSFIFNRNGMKRRKVPI